MRGIVFFIFFPLISSAQQSGNWFFTYPSIHTINIDFYEPAFWDSLVYYKSVDDQTGIENYLAATVTIDSVILDSVGIRFRGNSSYNHPGQKKPVQLDFNEFISGQDLDGLKKLNLNNSYMDPSMMREKLFLDILAEENILAPRCTYAKVYFNGSYVGLYKALETINKGFLSTRIGNNDGNLYKCEPLTPLNWEGNNEVAYYDNFEYKGDDTANSWTDLTDLIHVINNSSAEDYENAVSPFLHLDSFLKAWAANMLFGNLDTYFYLPHNFYLYRNETTGRFEWITWDVSLAFGVYAFLLTPNSVDFDIEYLPDDARNNRPLTYFCLKNESLRTKYFNHICYFLSNSFLPAKIFPRIDSIADAIRTAVYDEPASNRMFTTGEFEKNTGYETVNFQLIGQVPGLKDFIRRRRSDVIKQMCGKNWSCVLGAPTGSEVVSIYPNPSEDATHISFFVIEEGSPVNFDLYSLNGKKVESFLWFPDPGEFLFSYDVSDLAPGVYILKSSTGCRENTAKIVVR